MKIYGRYKVKSTAQVLWERASHLQFIQIVEG